MFEIVWKRKARRQLFKIKDSGDRHSVFDAVSELKYWPECRNVSKLTNHTYAYRLRVGRYRVFFDVEETVRIIDIQEVRKRDEHTY